MRRPSVGRRPARMRRISSFSRALSPIRPGGDAASPRTSSFRRPGPVPLMSRWPESPNACTRPNRTMSLIPRSGGSATKGQVVQRAPDQPGGHLPLCRGLRDEGVVGMRQRSRHQVTVAEDAQRCVLAAHVRPRGRGSLTFGARDGSCLSFSPDLTMASLRMIPGDQGARLAPRPRGRFQPSRMAVLRSSCGDPSGRGSRHPSSGRCPGTRAARLRNHAV